MLETFSKPVGMGDKGSDVRLAQEWLTFHGFATAIDARFGPATESCVMALQEKLGIPKSGRVDTETQAALLSPIVAAEAEIPPVGLSLGELVVAYARQHLEQHPIEIGGQNAGPWVRLYMNGKEGADWPWCAGFATFLLQHAARTLGVAMPHPYSFGCDTLAQTAKKNGRLLRPKTPADLVSVKPGYFFLVRKSGANWAHIGVVEAPRADTMLTIEGNTNDTGTAEGFEVCRRTRGMADKDFLLV